MDKADKLKALITQGKNAVSLKEKQVFIYRATLYLLEQEYNQLMPNAQR